MIASAIWPPPTNVIFFVNALATQPSENRRSLNESGWPLLDGHHIVVRHAHGKLRQRDSGIPCRVNRAASSRTPANADRGALHHGQAEEWPSALESPHGSARPTGERLLDLVCQKPSFALFRPGLTSSKIAGEVLRRRPVDRSLKPIPGCQRNESVRPYPPRELSAVEAGRWKCPAMRIPSTRRS